MATPLLLPPTIVPAVCVPWKPESYCGVPVRQCPNWSKASPTDDAVSQIRMAGIDSSIQVSDSDALALQALSPHLRNPKMGESPGRLFRLRKRRADRGTKGLGVTFRLVGCDAGDLFVRGELLDPVGRGEKTKPSWPATKKPIIRFLPWDVGGCSSDASSVTGTPGIDCLALRRNSAPATTSRLFMTADSSTWIFSSRASGSRASKIRRSAFPYWGRNRTITSVTKPASTLWATVFSTFSR